MRQKIPPRLREQVVQRDGLYCRHCGHGPMSVQWGCNQKGRVRLYNDWDQLGDRVIELDHVIPVSKGGGNEPENLVVFCDGCNARKSNRSMATVLRQPVPFSLLPRPSATELGWQPIALRSFP